MIDDRPVLLREGVLPFHDIIEFLQRGDAMADVKPFRGIHYDVKRVGDLTRVVAPPYDVISPEEQDALHRRHPRTSPGSTSGWRRRATARA